MRGAAFTGDAFAALAGGVRCLGFLLPVRFVLAMLFLLPVRSLLFFLLVWSVLFLLPVRSLHVSAFPPAGALPPLHRERERSLLFLVPVRSVLFLVPVWSLLFLLPVRSMLFLLSGESFRLSLLASPLLLLTIDCMFNQPSKRRHFSPFAHPRQAAVGR